MENCLYCDRRFNEEEMIDTRNYLLEGIMWENHIAGYYCEECLKNKEICNYCGKPTNEIVFQFQDIKYCRNCFEEVEEYIE